MSEVLVAPEPDDDTPHETSSASSVATEPRLCGEKEDDSLKLCCRLNCNGELETITGACRDGAGALRFFKGDSGGFFQELTGADSPLEGCPCAEGLGSNSVPGSPATRAIWMD